jgi:hypothetical protein
VRLVCPLVFVPAEAPRDPMDMDVNREDMPVERVEENAFRDFVRDTW